MIYFGLDEIEKKIIPNYQDFIHPKIHIIGNPPFWKTIIFKPKIY